MKANNIESKLFLEPLFLYGEGEYNLDAIKEVSVTDSFMTLGQEDRKCQDKEIYTECTTKLLKDAIMEKCGCIPFKLNLFKEIEQLITG